MLGAIVGDIIGSRFEFNNHRNKDFELFSDDCFATDDSIMSIAVAKAIMEAAKVKASNNRGYDHDFHVTLSELTICESIVSEYYPLELRIDDIRATYRFNETCQETVPHGKTPLTFGSDQREGR
jgi:hypothetical protein